MRLTLISLALASTAAFAPGGRSPTAPLRVASIEAPPAVNAPGLEGVRPDLAAAFGRAPKDMLDEEAKLAQSSFPLSPETLIGLTKAWLASQVDDDGMDWFAEVRAHALSPSHLDALSP